MVLYSVLRIQRLVSCFTIAGLVLLFSLQSEMSDVSPNEEFTTSLGADQSIRITVRPVSSVHNTRGGLLGGAKTNCITFTHSFVVKNTRSDSVHIKVSEQVPLSTDERIKVHCMSI